MTDINDAIEAHEAWMRGLLGCDLVEADLVAKHKGMRKNPLAFLRGTYFRWAETILATCPELADAPALLGIGDIHIENFGTWRDGEGRLVWGVNDFDEAAEMPYALDLVRLCASAILADAAEAPAPGAIAEQVLRGYAAGLAEPGPIILERDWDWLRHAAMVPEEDRAKFWRKMEALGDAEVPPRYRDALRHAMPPDAAIVAMAPRSGGMGSLGRPRFVARGEWHGGPVLREVKALLPSAWSRAHGGDTVIRAGVIAAGPGRAPDPFFAVTDGIAVRRLSPSNHKIELGDMVGPLLPGRLLEAMGRDIASCHAEDPQRAEAVAVNLARRPAGWLAHAAQAATAAVLADHAAYRARD